MSFKINVDSQLRGFWVAPNGSDSSSGESLEVPFLTFQAAVDACAALDPPPAFNFSGFITASQGGEFFDPIVMIDFISLDGVNCNLLVDADIAVTMSSFGLFNMTAISNTRDNGVCVDATSDVVRRGIDLLFMGIFGADGIGMNISGSVTDLFSSTRLVSIVGANGIGYNVTSESTNPIDIKVDVVDLSSDGAIFLNYDPANGTDELVVNVSTIDSTMGSNTTGFIAGGGRLVVESTGIFIADTIIHVKSGAIVDFNGAQVHGDIIVDSGGTLNALILDHDSGTITNNGTINGNIDGTNYGTYITDAVPGGSNTEIQYNNNGALDGIPGFTTDGINLAADGILEVGHISGNATNGALIVKGEDGGLVGGNLNLTGGAGQSNPGNVIINAGNGVAGNTGGGDVTINAGAGSGSGGRGDVILQTTNGNVGIGVTDPDSKLEISGQIKITGGAPGTGKVLTSDADGQASWEAGGGGGTLAETLALGNTTGGTDIDISGDSLTTSTGNALNIKGADGGATQSGSTVSVDSGDGGSTSGSGGGLFMSAGDGVAITGASGGTVVIASGDSSGGNSAGTCAFSGGQGGSTGFGGNVQIDAGDGGTISGPAGDITINGGDAVSGDAGIVTISGGISGDSDPGNIFLQKTSGNVGVGTITFDGSAILEVTSASKGFLMPRMTTAEKLNISSPATGLEVYDITLNQPEYFDGSVWVATAGSDVGSVTGGDNINISGSAQNPVVNLDDAVIVSTSLEVRDVLANDYLRMTHDDTEAFLTNGSGDLTIDNFGVTSKIIARIGADNLNAAFTIRNSSDVDLWYVDGAGDAFLKGELILDGGSIITPGGGSGAPLTIETGDGGAGNGGDLTLLAGTGAGAGGSVRLEGGDGAFAGGNVTLQSGSTTSSGSGGLLTLLAGVGAGSSSGGQVHIFGGIGGDSSGTGGQVLVHAGSGGNDNGDGALLSLEGGQGFASGTTDGGDVDIQGGQNFGGGTHGNVLLQRTDGFVGIGTNSPNSKLDIESSTTGNLLRLSAKIGNSAAVLNINSERTTAGNVGIINFEHDNVNVSQILGIVTDEPNNYGDLRFSTNGAGGFIQRMVIDQDGQVGIGTNNPNRALDVHRGDAVYIGISDNSQERFLTGYTEGESFNGGVEDNVFQTQMLADTNGNLHIASRSNQASAIIFYTTEAATTIAVERMRIAGNGVVTIDNLVVSKVAPQTIEIFTATDLDDLATAGVITVSTQTAFILKANITTSNRFDIESGIRFTIGAGGEGYSLTYDGADTFITSVDSIVVIETSLTATGGGTLFDITGQIGTIINIDFTLFSGWKMGTISRTPGASTGPEVFLLHMSSLNWQSTLVLDNVSVLGVDEVALIPFAGAGVPFLEIKGTTPGSYSVNLVSGSLAAGESLIRIDPGIANSSRITISDSTIGGTLFDTSGGSTGSFTAVTDAFEVIPISAVQDSGLNPGTAQFLVAGGTPVVFVGQELTLGDSTNPAYNGTHIISQTGVGLIELEGVAFVGDAEGTFESDTVTITSTSNALSESDTLVIDTANSTDYDGGATAYNVLTNSFQINRVFTTTHTGSWNTGGIDQRDPRVLADNNPGFVASKYIASAFVNDNSTANGAIVNNTFTDMEFGTLIAGSTMERWKLVDASLGIFEYFGNEPFDGAISFDFTVISSGGVQDFRFSWVIDTGSGFGDLPDPVEALVNVGGDAQSVTKTFPLLATKGDQIKPQITRNAGSSGITTSYATVFSSQ